MPVEELKVRAPLEALRGLADGDFDAAAFKTACVQFANFDDASSDPDLLQFNLDDSVLQVAIFNERVYREAENVQEQRLGKVSCAILPLAWWESWDRTQHKSDQTFRDESTSFDRCFGDALADATVRLGAPTSEGRDSDEPNLRFAFWQGKSGILALMQSTHDLQFGCCVCWWLQPWIGDVPRPRKGVSFEELLTERQILPPLSRMPVSWERAPESFEKELAREVQLNLMHPLRSVKLTALLRSTAADDVLFEVHGKKHPLVEVHLTWNREMLPDWPSFVFFNS